MSKRRPCFNRSTPLAERIAFYTIKGEPDECWLWSGSYGGAGYGQLTFKGKHGNAHVWAYIVAKGSVPAGMDVMHSCDNRKCVNPSHLSVGSRSQNMKDAIARGRVPHISAQMEIAKQKRAARALRPKDTRPRDRWGRMGRDGVHPEPRRDARGCFLSRKR